MEVNGYSGHYCKKKGVMGMFTSPPPPEYPFYGTDYDNIPVNVHGGLTFGAYVNEINNWKAIPNNIRKLKDWYVIGFDCAHYGDNPETCPKEFVLAETEHLTEQLLKLFNDEC